MYSTPTSVSSAQLHRTEDFSNTLWTCLKDIAECKVAQVLRHRLEAVEVNNDETSVVWQPCQTTIKPGCGRAGESVPIIHLTGMGRVTGKARSHQEGEHKIME
jgi:hypothetical protein